MSVETLSTSTTEYLVSTTSIQEVLVVNGNEELVINVPTNFEMVEVAVQGPKGAQGETGLVGEFTSDPLAYYILSKS